MTYSDLYFRKKERTFWLTCEEQNCTGLRVGGSKKNGSETTVVNQVRDDETWSAEAREVHYLGKLRICFGDSAAGDWIWIRCRNKRKDKVKDNFCLLTRPVEWMEIPVTQMKKNGEWGWILGEGIHLIPLDTQLYIW